jgi:hypothetical protein
MARNKNHHLKKIGNSWYFEKMVNGKRLKRALSDSVTEARKLRDDYLRDIHLYGCIQGNTDSNEDAPLFGELAQRWAKITEKRVKYSTYRGYRTAMNTFILKHCPQEQHY